MMYSARLQLPAASTGIQQPPVSGNLAHDVFGAPPTPTSASTGIQQPPMSGNLAHDVFGAPPTPTAGAQVFGAAAAPTAGAQPMQQPPLSGNFWRAITYINSIVEFNGGHVESTSAAAANLRKFMANGTK